MEKLSVAFTLGAVLSNKHNSNINQIKTDFNRLGQTVKEVSNRSKNLDQFAKARESFLKTSAVVREAKNKLEALKKTYEQAPSDRLARQIRNANDALSSAKLRSLQQRQELVKLKDELGKAGIATHQLANEKIRLGRVLEQTKHRLESFNRVQQQRQVVKEAWQDTRHKAAIGAVTAATVGFSVAKPLMASANFEDQLRQIAITGEFANTIFEKQLGASIRKNALLYNQSTEAINQGVNTLVAEGFANNANGVTDISRLQNVSGTLAMVATATRADFEDLAKMAVNFDKTLGVKDIELAFSQVAKAGKLGSFEIKDMAKWFPQLGGLMKSLGIHGHEAVISMASRLQIAKKTAGSNDEAANNFKNFLSKLTSPDTQKDFAKLGINLQQKMMNAAAKGLDPISAGINETLNVIAKKSPESIQALHQLNRQIAAIKDPAARAEELERRREFIEQIGQRAGIGQVFQDMQAVSYLLAELQNGDTLNSYKKEVARGRSDSGHLVIEQDFLDQSSLTTSKLNQAKNALSELGRIFGESIKPMLDSGLDIFTHSVTGFVRLSEQFPKATQSIMIGATLLGGFAVVAKVWVTVKSIAALMRSIRGLSTVQNALKGGGFLRSMGSIFTRLAVGIRSVIGSLIRFVPVVFRVLLGLSRFLLFTPWGLAASAIIGVGILIWQNWDTIKEKAGKLWQKIKTVWNEGVQWFQALPNRFLAIGGAIVDGLVQGIITKFNWVKNTLTRLAQQVGQVFKDTLGIKSPSRVFMYFGQMIGKGAELGMLSTQKPLQLASAILAKTSQQEFGVNNLAYDRSLSLRRGHNASASTSNQNTYHFNIQISQNAGENGLNLARRVAQEVKQIMQSDRRAALGDWA